MGELSGNGVGDLTEDREHRPLDRVPHRLVSRIGRLGEGRGDEGGIDRLARAGSELFRSTPDDLAEDHSGIPSGAEQGRPGQRRDEFGPTDLVERASVVEVLQLLGQGPHGHRHVVAGVAVGYGEDIEVVDLLPSRIERAIGRRHDALEALDAGVTHWCESRREAGVAARNRRLSVPWRPCSP